MHNSINTANSFYYEPYVAALQLHVQYLPHNSVLSWILRPLTGSMLVCCTKERNIAHSTCNTRGSILSRCSTQHLGILNCQQLLLHANDLNRPYLGGKGVAKEGCICEITILWMIGQTHLERHGQKCTENFYKIRRILWIIVTFLRYSKFKIIKLFILGIPIRLFRIRRSTNLN